MTLRIIALVLASTVAFMALAIAENFDLFWGTLAGEQMLPTAPPPEELVPVIRAARKAQRRGEVFGVAGSPARLASEADLAYRQRAGITQVLDHGKLELDKVGFSGPGALSVSTRESLDVGLAQAGRALKYFRMSGSWHYELRDGGSGYQIYDLQPLSVEVQSIESVPLQEPRP